MLKPLRRGRIVSAKEQCWMVMDMITAENVLKTIGMIPGSFIRSVTTSTTSGMRVMGERLKF